MHQAKGGLTMRLVIEPEAIERHGRRQRGGEMGPQHSQDRRGAQGGRQRAREGHVKTKEFPNVGVAPGL